MTEQFLSAKDICAERGISIPTFYRLIKLGHIPRGERVGVQAVRWRRSILEQAFVELNKDRAA